MLFDILHSIKIGSGAIGDNKVVILDSTDGSFDIIFLRFNLCDFAESEEKIFLLCKPFSKWKNNGTGLQTGRGNLIE